MRAVKSGAILALGWLVANCGGESPRPYAPSYAPAHEASRLELRFGVLPVQSPQSLFEAYAPIVEHLNRNLAGAPIRLEASRSYEEFEKKLYSRQLHLALSNPVQALEALGHGYRVFGKMGDDERFRGLLIVRRDSGIESVADLRGKAVSFPAPTALAATMMPLFFLHEEGLDPHADIEQLFSGSQESSILNVYLRRSAAAGTWLVPWQTFSKHSPEFARELVVRWETPPLVNNALVVRDDVPPALARDIASLFFSLHEHEDGRRLLAAIPLSRFEPASEATYEPVRRFLTRYRELVG